MGGNVTKLKVEVEFLKSELAETADAWGVGSFNDQDITVIGNIHETPELLTENTEKLS
jgi:hypothetical protein